MSQMNKCIESDFCSIKSDSFSEREASNICQLGVHYKRLFKYIKYCCTFQSKMKATLLQIHFFIHQVILANPLHFCGYLFLCTDFLTLLPIVSTNLNHRDGVKGSKVFLTHFHPIFAWTELCSF